MYSRFLITCSLLKLLFWAPRRANFTKSSASDGGFLIFLSIFGRKKILKKKFEEEFWEEKFEIFFIRNSENIKNLDFKYLFFVTSAVPKASKKQFQ